MKFWMMYGGVDVAVVVPVDVPLELVNVYPGPPPAVQGEPDGPQVFTPPEAVTDAVPVVVRLPPVAPIVVERVDEAPATNRPPMFGTLKFEADPP